jgi:predicted RNase H-like HicB family nuclease
MNKLIEEYKNKYSYTVSYSASDEVHVAKCLELGVQAHGSTQLEAITEVMKVVDVALQWLLDDGEDIPERLENEDENISKD